MPVGPYLHQDFRLFRQGVKMNSKTKIMLVAVLALSAAAFGAVVYEAEEADAAHPEYLRESNENVEADWLYVALAGIVILSVMEMFLYRRKEKF